MTILEARGQFPADLLGFGFLPVQAEGLFVPVLAFGFLLEREPVFVGAVHIVEDHCRLLFGCGISCRALVTRARRRDAPLSGSRAGVPSRAPAASAPG